MQGIYYDLFLNRASIKTDNARNFNEVLLAFWTRIVHAASRSDDANISLRDHELISLLMKLKQV